MTAYAFGNDEAILSDYAWWGKNSQGKTHSVGQKKPNGFGLYDVHGNVWEWCQDVYAADYYKQSPAVDPTGPPAGTRRVVRGGSCWYDDFAANLLRCAHRHGDRADMRIPAFGLRVARSTGF